MQLPQTLAIPDHLALAVMDFYELSMAEANSLEGILGKKSIFDLVVRKLPEEKYFATHRWTSFFPNGRSVEHEAVKEKKEQKPFLVNAGLEQAAAYLLKAKGSKELSDYLKNIQGITDEKFLSWVEKIKFSGDVYAMTEGTIFFAHEPQLQIHDGFEVAQLFESILLTTINPQTNVATVANEIAAAAPGKILLEGGSRRAGSPQSAIYNSRAARIGGFHASSNVAFGMAYEEKVGGTVGHSYIMLHASEYAAFKAQTKLLGSKVCFLLDTYDVKKALETTLKVIEEEKLEHFAFRLDSGNLEEQAKWLHAQMKEKGYARQQYDLVVSDDLTAKKIRDLENSGADIDKYLVGTFLVHPPKPLGGVFKLAAFYENTGFLSMDIIEADRTLQMRGKFSENPEKATLPGIKQVYRVMGDDGFYKKDLIALIGEDISPYLKGGDMVEELLVPIIKEGRQVYDFPTINEISRHKEEQLKKFRDIENYPVIISEGIRKAQEEVRRKYKT